MLAVRMYRLACMNDVFHFLQQQTCEEQTKHTLCYNLRKRMEGQRVASLITQMLEDQMMVPY
jgi:hypothetical protein